MGMVVGGALGISGGVWGKGQSLKEWEGPEGKGRGPGEWEEPALKGQRTLSSSGRSL